VADPPTPRLRWARKEVRIMPDKGRNIGQIVPDQAQTIMRRVHGREVELPIGGGSIGNSGFTVFEARAVDALKAERLRQLNADELSKPKGLFELD
jgi:hypothetical protein